MSSAAAAVDVPTPAPSSGQRHLRLALLVIASAQLMVVLDGTIVNIALPSIQQELHLSGTSLSWIVNSYALAFGGLLLLGGRAGDLFGRRRMFRTGIAVFTAASLLGGLAPNEQLLLIARVLQGVGAAVIAPTALSLIATTFSEGRERGRAMGIYAAMSGLGSTVGLLLGGVLTEYLDWRWVMFVNVPIGVAVILGSKVLAGGRSNHGRLDVPGAITATAGLAALVYAITRGGDDGWGDRMTLGFFIAAAVLLAVFILLQARLAHPMLPLHILGDRNRAGSYLTMLFVGAGMFATFYFLTLYLQQVHGFSPVKTGLAYLPFSAGMVLASAVLGPRLSGRLAPRVLIIPGLVVGSLGMFWFSRLTPDSGYAAHVMPAMFITALGLGTAFLPLTLGAVAGVDRANAGIASALLNAAQQIGGAVGLAVLTTVATAVSDDALPNAPVTLFQALTARDFGLAQRAAAAVVDGYTAAFLIATAFLAAAMVIAAVTINARRQSSGRPVPAGMHS